MVVTTKEDVPIESSKGIKVQDNTTNTGIKRHVGSSKNCSTELIEAASDTNLSTAGCQYKKRKQFETIPDILQLDHLTVSGDVSFGKGVSLRGSVIIIANHGDKIDIPSCNILTTQR